MLDANIKAQLKAYLDKLHPDLFRQVIADMPPRNIVVVAVPDQLHYDVIMTALRANQHVLTVKPLVLKASQAMEIEREELDIAPAEGQGTKQAQKETKAELLKALDEAAAGARSALEKTSDEHLMTNWKLLAGGNVVMELPRYQFIQETINHWAHHRGQMTVYLRLMGAKVPALYGPSADEQGF